MSEDETKILENSPLLKRVLESQERTEAHIQSVEDHFKTVESHIQTLEASFERHGFNTTPMWERALSEFGEVKSQLGEVKQNVATLSRKIDVFTGDMLNLRAEQLQNDERLRRLEAENESGGMTTIN